MNVLGKAVYRTLRGTVGDPRRMIVIHDCLYQNPGQIKLSDKVSPGGHRGVRSVNKALYASQPDQYYRLHVGIGNNEKVKNREFVLKPLSAYEKEHYSPNGAGIDDVWKLIEKAALKGEEYRDVIPMKRPLP